MPAEAACDRSVTLSYCGFVRPLLRAARASHPCLPDDELELSFEDALLAPPDLLPALLPCDPLVDAMILFLHERSD